MKIKILHLIIALSVGLLQSVSVVASDQKPGSFWEVSAVGYTGETKWVQNSFGIFSGAEPLGPSSWISHHTHGWIYIHSETIDSVWMYAPGDGWTWTNINLYPYVYDLERGWMYYLQGFPEARWFYVVSEESWMEVPSVFPVEDYFTRNTSPVMNHFEQPVLPEGYELTEYDSSEDIMMAGLHLLVHEDGSVSNVSLVFGSAIVFEDEKIHAAMIESILDSSFRPGTRGGRQVTLHHSHIIYFRQIS